MSVQDYFSGSGLIAVPHMDDAELACGGTIALLPNKAAWHVVCYTDGMGSPEPVLPRRDKITSDLVHIRQAESRSALAVLGIPVENVHFMDFPDGRLRQHSQALCRALTDWIAQWQPDHVLVPFRYDRHPDHLALNRAASHLVQTDELRARLTEYFVYHQWRLLPGGDLRRYIRPDLLQTVDISAVAARKRAALDCFASQTTRFYAWQQHPVLSADLLEAVSHAPEMFVRYDAKMAGAAVFDRAASWIRIAHRLEPWLKQRKHQLAAWRQKWTRCTCAGCENPL